MKKLLKLFAVFFKIGLFTFGGGYAMISLIESECAKQGWADKKDILDMVTLAESTPGVIAINSATFVGYRVGGFFGALFATIGVVLPSFVIISSLYFVLSALSDNFYLNAVFQGVRACVAVLIFRAFATLYTQLERAPLSYILMAAAFAYATFTSLSVIYIILLALLAGGIIGGVKARRSKQ